MALHAPTIHTPAVIHVPRWLEAVALAVVVIVAIGLAYTFWPVSEPMTPEDAYAAYRAGEQDPGFSAMAIQNAWLDYRAGERAALP